jgi:hypothetical protein
LDLIAPGKSPAAHSLNTLMHNQVPYKRKISSKERLGDGFMTI